MPTTRTTYSGFLRGPSEVLPRLETGDVLLERRDGEDLILTTAGRAEAFREGLELGVAALRSLALTRRDVLAEVLVANLPWLQWLPDEDRIVCVDELVNDLAASVEVENFTRFHQDLVAWLHTAEAWSDPALAERLRTDLSGDAGEVVRPGAVA